MNKSRRKFLTQSACGLSAAALASAADRLGLINSIVQAQDAVATDYKALVCVFLSGGSDCNNMLVDLNQFSAYAAARGNPSISPNLGLTQSMLLAINPASGGQFGLHPNLSPEVATPAQPPGLLKPWQDGRLAMLCNYGPLLRPTTKAQYQANIGGAYRPYQLFSHSDQINQQMSSIVNTTGQTGWAGRVADNTGGLNGPTILPMSLSVGGTNLLQTGITTRQIAIGTGSLQNVLSLNWSGPASAAPFTNGSGFRQLLSFDTNQVLIKGASDTMNTALNADQILNQPDPTIPTPPNVTAFPSTGIGNQLKQVAKLIKIKDTLGMKRQIFFCTLGGFDTHTNETGSDPTNPGGQGTQSGTQGGLLTQFSQAARAFYDEMNAQGNATNVTLFTLSDFGRTFQASGLGAGTVGTDHAWGSHAFIMGGAVLGGTFYGTYPTLAANGPDDDGGNRGRWIPTTSIDQYGATLARWYGLDPALLTTVFPNLSKFPTQNLGFLG
ncbi:MAG TPA: DUF1501 domain-containing protein [Pyrinomonadaceae bacterium]|nr:DUF1501 domain-containing protein [Pyrinomonadaceae bacterium]